MPYWCHQAENPCKRPPSPDPRNHAGTGLCVRVRRACRLRGIDPGGTLTLNLRPGLRGVLYQSGANARQTFDEVERQISPHDPLRVDRGLGLARRADCRRVQPEPSQLWQRPLPHERSVGTQGHRRGSRRRIVPAAREHSRSPLPHPVSDHPRRRRRHVRRPSSVRVPSGPTRGSPGDLAVERHVGHDLLAAPIEPL